MTVASTQPNALHHKSAGWRTVSEWTYKLHLQCIQQVCRLQKLQFQWHGNYNVLFIPVLLQPVAFVLLATGQILQGLCGKTIGNYRSGIFNGRICCQHPSTSV